MVELYSILTPELFVALPPTVTEPLNTALPSPLIDATFAPACLNTQPLLTAPENVK